MPVFVKTAKGRKISSTRWLARHINDVYVKLAKSQGYRSRAAYKLIELIKKFDVLKNAKCVLDLGASPGGWSQVVAKQGIEVIAIDRLKMLPIAGVSCWQLDIMDEVKITEVLQKKTINVVMADLAPNISGNRSIDHLSSLDLCEAAFKIALVSLTQGGSFITKLLSGGKDKDFVEKLKIYFKTVKYFKPQASRKESTEFYIVAQGFHKQK